jgi:hypothetical protein
MLILLQPVRLIIKSYLDWGKIFNNENLPSLIDRFDGARCTYPIYQSGASSWRITQYMSEHAGSGDGWEETLYDVYDPSNLGKGELAWCVSVEGGSGDQLTKNGGVNIIVRYLNGDPYWTTAGRPTDGINRTGFNQTTGKLETFNGTTWIDLT